DDVPAGRRGDGQLEGSLEIGLVEAGVDPVRVERLQVGVRVDAAVRRIGEAVESLTVARVCAVGGYPQLILGRQAGQRYPVPVEGTGWQRLAGQRHRADGWGGQGGERAPPPAGAAR